MSLSHRAFGAVALTWAGLLFACEEPAAPHAGREPVEPRCQPGEVRACYGGPEGTAGVGRCVAGEQICHASGRGFGPCEGERWPEPEDCATVADENCDGLTTCGETLFSWRFGAERDETVTRLAVDDAGSIHLAGHYREPFELGSTLLEAQNGTRDVYVTKLDAAGEVVWVRSFFGGAHLSPRGLAVASDGRVGVALGVVGTVQTAGLDPIEGAGGSDVLLALLGADGEVIWTRRMGDDEDQRPEAVAFASDGALVAVGGAEGTIDFGDGPRAATEEAEPDAFVAAYDLDGSLRFGALYPGTNAQRARDVAVAPDGRIGVVGETFGEVDFGGGPLASAGERDAFALALEADGGHRFSRRWGDAQLDRAHAVAFDGEGAMVVVGRFEGQLRVGPSLHVASGGAGFAIKLDQAGELAWSRAWAAANAGAYDVAIDSRDRVVVSGFYEDQLDFGNSALPPGGVREQPILVMKLEPSGEPVWARGLAVRGDQAVSDVFRARRVVAVGPEDEIHVAGFVEGALDFGDDLDHEALGGADAFLWTLAP